MLIHTKYLLSHIMGFQKALFEQNKEWSFKIFAWNDVSLWNIDYALRGY